MNDFENIFSELNEAKVKYLVVGGVAVFIHGYQRFTGDLDLLLLLNKENLKKVSVAMGKLGYRERLPISITELDNVEKVRMWLKDRNLKAFSFVPDDPENSVVIDVIIEESLNFEKILKESVVRSFGDVSISVVSIDDLIKMKKKAGRKKDEIDVEALLSIKEICKEQRRKK